MLFHLDLDAFVELASEHEFEPADTFVVPDDSEWLELFLDL